MDNHDDLPEKIRTVLLALEGRVSVISDRLNHVVADRLVLLDASIKMLAEAVMEVNANVKQMRDQMSLLEDAREMYVGLSAITLRRPSPSRHNLGSPTGRGAQHERSSVRSDGTG